MGKEDLKCEPQSEALAERADGAFPEFGASGFHQPPELDARGACCFTGTAHEAAVHMRVEGLVDIDATLTDSAHEVDPPARRLRLQSSRTLRGAGVQAEAAVDATGEIVDGWAAIGGE